MDTQKDREPGELELTAEELDNGCGGLRNNQTEWWAAVQAGMVQGFEKAGGSS
jgi:hypothetical protein